MSNDTVLNWGILGLGSIAREKMIPALRQSPVAHIHAVASKSMRGDMIAGAQYYNTYEKLLADPELDIIYIALPNGLHVEWVHKALDAGKHVLCEKPIALSESDVKSLKVHADNVGKRVLEGFMYRHSHKTQKISELLISGAIGTVVSARSSFYSLRSRATGIRADKDLGGGSLWDLGIYPLNLFHLLKPEEPKIVQAAGKRLDSGVDSYLSGTLLYGDGTIFSFYCGWINDMREMETTIIGTEGKLKVGKMYHADPDVITIVRANGEETINIAAQDAFQAEAEAFTRWITDGIEPSCTLDESAQVARIAERILDEMVLV